MYRGTEVERSFNISSRLPVWLGLAGTVQLSLAAFRRALHQLLPLVIATSETVTSLSWNNARILFTGRQFQSFDIGQSSHEQLGPASCNGPLRLPSFADTPGYVETARNTSNTRQARMVRCCWRQSPFADPCANTTSAALAREESEKETKQAV